MGDFEVVDTPNLLPTPTRWKTLYAALCDLPAGKSIFLPCDEGVTTYRMRSRAKSGLVPHGRVLVGVDAARGGIVVTKGREL